MINLSDMVIPADHRWSHMIQEGAEGQREGPQELKGLTEGLKEAKGLTGGPQEVKGLTGGLQIVNGLTGGPEVKMRLPKGPIHLREGLLLLLRRQGGLRGEVSTGVGVIQGQPRLGGEQGLLGPPVMEPRATLR